MNWIKILNFMGLTYKDLYSTTPKSVLLRQNLYKEKTNVLAYYIIATILMNNYQGFLSWCNTSNNNSILQFKKTDQNINDFCKFIENNYKSNNMLTYINCMQDFLIKIKKNKNTPFILNNMRMTLCELG